MSAYDEANSRIADMDDLLPESDPWDHGYVRGYLHGFQSGSEWGMDNNEQIIAWHAVATHPFFKDCYNSEKTLTEAFIDKLDVAMEEFQIQKIQEILDTTPYDQLAYYLYKEFSGK